MSKASTSPSVIVEEVEAKKGKIGHLKLNAPKSLNSLTLEMVQSLYSALTKWQNDKEIAVVYLEGEGEKAFCAGGDVQQLYKSATEQPGGPCEYAEQFFTEEYRLNYLIHTYQKPIICIGKGIVMGGGLGLMAGASHRVVSETTRIAMPEITIGLFPDVGGTHFLNRMPHALGIFFGLTGASINAHDALITKLGDHFVENQSLPSLFQQLQDCAWLKDPEKNLALVEELIQAKSTRISELELESELSPYLGEIESACRETSLGDIVHELSRISSNSKWFDRALGTLSAGSPLSALLIFEQLRRFRYANLANTFRSELILATNIVRYPEFSEGVRALLIDKDKKPKWQFPHFSHVPASLMEQFFTAPWGDIEHPLSDLN